MIRLAFQSQAAIYLPEHARYDHLSSLPSGQNVGEAMLAIEESVTNQDGNTLLDGASTV